MSSLYSTFLDAYEELAEIYNNEELRDKVKELKAKKNMRDLNSITNTSANKHNWHRLSGGPNRHEIIDEDIDWDKVQYGVHQFSTSSIIFRGTEEECQKYIDERPELWEDAEVYFMTPDDPHYKKDESLEEAIKSYPHDYDKIELEYKNLEFTQCGNKRDADDWDEWDRKEDWSYEADKDDVYSFIFEECIDIEDFPRGFDDEFDPDNDEDWNSFVTWLEANFDEIFTKYEDKILDHFETEAIEDAQETYVPDDYRYDESIKGDNMKFKVMNEDGNNTLLETNEYGEDEIMVTCDGDNCTELITVSVDVEGPSYCPKCAPKYMKKENESLNEEFEFETASAASRIIDLIDESGWSNRYIDLKDNVITAELPDNEVKTFIVNMRDENTFVLSDEDGKDILVSNDADAFIEDTAVEILGYKNEGLTEMVEDNESFDDEDNIDDYVNHFHDEAWDNFESTYHVYSIDENGEEIDHLESFDNEEDAQEYIAGKEGLYHIVKEWEDDYTNETETEVIWSSLDNFDDDYSYDESYKFNEEASIKTYDDSFDCDVIEEALNESIEVKRMNALHGLN